MKFAFIEQHAFAGPVSVSAHMLGVLRSGYDESRDRPPNARTTANLALLSDVRRLQVRHQGRYRSPRMHAAPGLRRGRLYGRKVIDAAAAASSG